MSIAAHDGADRADQLEAIARRLIELVSSEIRALEARQLDASSRDFEEKERLAHAWRIEVQRLKADPGLLAGASAAQRRALLDVSVELESLLARHAVTLEAMKSVTEGLVKAVAGEIATQRAAPAGYGRTGAISQPRAPATGLTLNAKA